jgi:hypothetical protein
LPDRVALGCRTHCRRRQPLHDPLIKLAHFVRSVSTEEPVFRPGATRRAAVQCGFGDAQAYKALAEVCGGRSGSQVSRLAIAVTARITGIVDYEEEDKVERKVDTHVVSAS